MQYESRVKVLAENGQLTVSGSNLTLKGADHVTILLAAATDFANSPEQKWRGEKPGPKLDRILAAASEKSFDQLKSAHIADHQALFGRVKANFGPARDNLPTDQRLAAYQKTHEPGLDALFYQYGRYLLIASSRPGGLPANLQGIWNQDLKPAWYSGYTTNINVEMNYWLAEPTNLSECHQPFFDWLRNLATVRKKNAQPAIAAKRGWTAYSTNNPMGGNSTWGIHRPGPAWMTQHLWTHYEFTGDKEFLKTRAYPALKELVEYWEDFLVEGPDGKLITPAGWSPEHGPVKKDGKIVIEEGDRTPQPGASYDQQIVWDLFTNYIDAAGRARHRRRLPRQSLRNARQTARSEDRQMGSAPGMDGGRGRSEGHAPPCIAPFRGASGPPDQSHPHTGSGQGRHRLAQRPRRWRHRLEQGLENQLLGPARRMATAPTRS